MIWGGGNGGVGGGGGGGGKGDGGGEERGRYCGVLKCILHWYLYVAFQLFRMSCGSGSGSNCFTYFGSGSSSISMPYIATLLLQ